VSLINQEKSALAGAIEQPRRRFPIPRTVTVVLRYIVIQYMFDSDPKFSNRNWLPNAIAAGLLAIVVVAATNTKALIRTLPFGFGDRILDRNVPDELRQVFPDATSFSKRETAPVPHYVAYTGAANSRTVAGYAFWTTELQPDERGYDGPITMLVGIDMNARLTGVLVTEQHEPYGYFSVGLPSFARQFKGKDIHDAFKVGLDVAAISRASISVNSASRAIRNSARIAARALLPRGMGAAP
jgi:transcriptional regulator of nitric oxide reductase